MPSSDILREIISVLLESEQNYKIVDGKVAVPLADLPEQQKVDQEVFFLLTDDQYSKFSREREWNVNARLYLPCHGKLGTLDRKNGTAGWIVSFPQGPRKIDKCLIADMENLYVLHDNTPPDWRPDETLPEDYYAL